MPYFCLPHRSSVPLVLLVVVGCLAPLWLPVKSAAAFCPSGSVWNGWKQSVTLKHQSSLWAFGVEDDNNDDDPNKEEEVEDGPGKLKRKRDRIKEWISAGKSNKSPMVRPIRMEDGTVEEAEQKAPKPAWRSASRLKANFDDMFAGMPSMQDILGDNSNKEEQKDTNGNNNNPRAKSRQDDSWFDEERKQIEASYEQMYNENVAQFQEQRRQDPESLPSNAEAMFKDVLIQEMMLEIRQKKELRARENLAKYGDEQKEAVDTRDIEGVTSERVDNLLKEDQIAREKAAAIQARIDEYKRYEFEAFLRDQNGNGRTEPKVPDANTDLDLWALQRLEKLVESREDESDEDFIVTDIVEDRLEELKERMEQKGRKSRIQPETLKEWQMYRAIATRLGMDEMDDAVSERISAQLQSWKDYVSKEDIIRKKSGLARGPKLPFEWQESGRDREIEEARMKAALEKQEGKSKVDVRKEVNRKSIEALEMLLETSDGIRAERLRKEIEALKQTLEANDYLDVDESFLEEDAEDELGPVDISDIFSKQASEVDRTSSFNDNYEAFPPPNPPYFESADTAKETTPPPRPNTPFFDDDDDDEDSVESPPKKAPATPFFAQDEDLEDTPKPPDTPFFSSSEDESMNDTKDVEYKLGTIEEQKLRAMYQRAGARTEEEKAAIRAKWESFQAFEKSRRDESGLTDGDDSELLKKAKLGYDLADVKTEDGDFDAAKILASIGPRPSRKRKAGGTKPQSSTTEDESPLISSDLDPTEVKDSLYRAVSAVGGGRTKDDPEAKAREKAAFTEFMEKEDEMRQSLDELEEDISSALTDVEGEFDDAAYAEDVLSSLGPRPKPKRRRISESEYSDRSIALGSSDDDDSDSDDDDDEEQDDGRRSTPTERFSSEPEDDLVPGWLRKERDAARKRGESSGGRGSFLGSDIDDVFNDDEYEHNMRQLAEYERRRAGGKKQMGIDISDVLGRSSDDYADYNYDDNYFRAKKSGWGTSGFVARKQNLLEYTELSVMELNSLMDHKDSVHSTGVSQYLPRINKPFKEFGAIFRLEGVLIDTTGMQYNAWTRVAKRMGFRMPTLDEARRASVLRSDVAIREAFFWTDDVILCRDTAAAHQQALAEVFNEWLESSSVDLKDLKMEPESDKGSLAIGEESPPALQVPSLEPKVELEEGKKLKLLTDAWSRTAITHRLASPSKQQVEMAAVLSPDIAVRQAFRWSSDQSDIDKYVATYRSVMQDLLGIPPPKTQNYRMVEKNPEPSKPKRVLDQNAKLELEFHAWTKLAEDNGFEAPLPDEVLAAVVINDPEIAIRDGFGWTDDRSKLPELVASYKKHLNALIEEYTGVAKAPETAEIKEATTKAEAPRPVRNGNEPTEEELFEMQHHAWRSAALNHSFQLPPMDQLQVAKGLSPAEAVTRLFGWTSDESMVQAICNTYRSALKDISQKYIQKYKLPPGTNFFPDLGQDKVSVNQAKAPVDGDDVAQAVFDAWTAVAKKSKFALPDEEEVLFAMSVGPEEAVISGFQWAEDPAEVAKIVEDYKAEIQSWRSKRGKGTTSEKKVEGGEKNDALPFFSVVPGAEKWVRSLEDVDMQCSVVSHLNRQQVDVLLEAAGLSHLFDADKRVTASNNYGREMDQLLGASLRLERRPDHCVVFDASPNAANAAHDVDMRSVGVIGAFPRYELLTADSTASSFEELTAMNIRRLFGERIYDQALVDMQQADPEKLRKTKTKFFWDDD